MNDQRQEEGEYYSDDEYYDEEYGSESSENDDVDMQALHQQNRLAVQRLQQVAINADENHNNLDEEDHGGGRANLI